MHRALPFASAVGGAVFVLYVPVLAALLLACLLSAFCLLDSLSPAGWVIASPALYLAWLLLFLACSSIEMQLWRLAGYRRPRRVDTADGLRAWVHVILTLAIYLRGFFISALPGVFYLQMIPILRLLVYLAYGHRATLGNDSIIFGFLYDPELTQIGNGSMIGGGARISAHSVVPSLRGGWVYNSAPVTIGPRSVVGGEARVGLGVTIGADCVVEPGSSVPPFTTIPDGEVWGGNPAKYIRMRSESLEEPDADLTAPLLSTSAECELERAARTIVAEALGQSASDVPASLSAETCANWDSLAQLAILAMLHSRFGVEAAAQEAWRLQSIPRIVRYLKNARGAGQQTLKSLQLPKNPELLPLLDHDLVTQALAAREQERESGTQPAELPVVIAATFTAEPLAAALKLWGRAFDVAVRVEFAGYNQVQQTLLAPDGPFYCNPTGLNLVLTRPEDLLGMPGQMAETLADALLDACARFAGERPGTLVVATLPPAVSTLFTLDREATERCRAHWRSRLSQMPGIELLDFSSIVEQLGVEASRKTDLEVVARSPYSARLYQELGIALARLARGRRRPPAKVLALDADQVLWGGVLAEDGIDGIAVGPDHPGRSFQLFQEQVLRLKSRGVLLVLVSRNSPEDVWQALENHPGMVLRRRDFAASRVNWLPKSQNLRDLAAELNLGLDTFVFFDDDPAIRLEVEANAPAVTVVPVPADPALYCQTLSRLWCFDVQHATAEDAARTAMMHHEHARQKQRESAGDIQSYLRSLGLVVRMRAAQPADLARVAQLTQKTNQFNLSLKRRSVAEIRALDPSAAICVIEASDHFGDYGLVGVCIVVPHPGPSESFELDTFLLSCRVLGRGVEEATLYGLAALIRSRGGRRLAARFIAGPRNQPIKDFLLRSGFSELSPDVLECAALERFALPEHVTWSAGETSPTKLAG